MIEEKLRTIDDDMRMLADDGCKLLVIFREHGVASPSIDVIVIYLNEPYIELRRIGDQRMISGTIIFSKTYNGNKDDVETNEELLSICQAWEEKDLNYFLRKSKFYSN